MPDLAAVDPVAADEAPSVSIVVAARDEARHIAAAVNTLLSQDYPAFEVVVVDDRSRDGTGAILDRLEEGREVRSTDATAPEGAAAEGEAAPDTAGSAAGTPSPGHGGPALGWGWQGDPALTVIHVAELTDGWLGKNHALHAGAERARGDLLLFTDADVLMRADAVARAVGLLERDGLDHLAVAPRIQAGTTWTQAVVAVFLVAFNTVFRPWKAVDPRSRAHVGVGAFNLVRAEAYRRIGGHRSLRLRPDDDLRLGRTLKEAGFRQAAGRAPDRLAVEWYPSVAAMARGLRKNAFAVVDYRLALVAAGTLLPVAFTFWPIAALFLTEGLTWWLNLAVVGVGLWITADTSALHGLPLWTAALYPVASLLFLSMVWLAALRATARGSVEWRGTEYSLDELKRG